MGSTRTPPAATSKWCNRSLRPLNSAIRRLDKYWETASAQYQARRSQQVAGDDPNDIQSRKNDRRATTDSGGADASEPESPKNDPTWVPDNAVQRHIKHKYSNRARSKVVVQSPVTERLQPGEFTIATPLILGKDRQIFGINRKDDDTSLKISASVDSKTKSADSGDLLGVDEDLYGESCLAIMKSIFNTLGTFLKATLDEHKSENTHGAPSLLAMALRKTSKYIFLEQERLKNMEDVEEDIDVADVFFTDLEETYAFSNQGWKPLRALVRAHGIRLVCEAIRKQQIHPDFSRILVRKCLGIKANDAAEAFLEASLSIVPRIKDPDSWQDALLFKETFAGSSSLSGFLKKTDNYTVFFRELTRLLLRGVISLDWMTTKSMTDYVSEAVNCILREDEHTAASANFLTLILQKSVGSPELYGAFSRKANHIKAVCYAPPAHLSRLYSRTNTETTNEHHIKTDRTSISKSLNNTICCTLMCLCGAHISRYGNDPCSDSFGWQVITQASTVVQRHIKMAVEKGRLESSEDQQVRMGYIMLSHFLLEHLQLSGESPRDTSIYSPSLLTSFNHFMLLSRYRKEVIAVLSGFLHQVQVCLTRGGVRNRFDVALSTASLLETVNLKAYPVFRAALAKAIVVFAHHFAEVSCLPQHEIWVVKLQKKVARFELEAIDHEAEPASPSLCLAAAGFRYEDGIGEWVARTPCAKHRGTSQPTHQRRLHHEPVREIIDDSTASDEASDSESESDSEVDSSGDEPRSSTTPNSSPLPFLRTRRICAAYSESDSDDETTVSSPVSNTRSQTQQSQVQNPPHAHSDEVENEPSRPMTRKHSVQTNRRANAKGSSQSIAVAIAVELPSSGKRKLSNLEVVIRPTSFTNREGKRVQNSRVDVEDDDEDEEEDAIAGVATYTKRRRSERLRHSFSQVGHRHPARIPTGRVSDSRRVSERLAGHRVQQVTSECLDRINSSEDELSFL